MSEPDWLQALLRIRKSLAAEREGCTCSGGDPDEWRIKMQAYREVLTMAVHQIDDEIAAGLTK